MIVTCGNCGAVISRFLRGTRHENSARCRAGRLARKLEAKGLVPCVTVTAVQYVEAALRLFEFECRRETTKTHSPRGTPTKADQCWTTPEGAAVMHVVDRTSAFLHCTFPAAAKRLHEHRDLVPQLVTIAALGGAPTKAMYRLLRPIDYREAQSGKRTYKWAEKEMAGYGDKW